MSDERTRAASRRYAVLPKETIRLYAESAGHANLPDEVTEVLAEDVSYRLRDLIQQSCEFTKHAKRRKMSTKYFTAALRNSDVQPIFGHGFSEPLTFCQTKEAEVFFYDDPEVNLSSLALACHTPNLSGKKSCKASWVAVEGVRTGSCLPQANAQGKPSERGPRPLSEDSLLYFDMVTRAILGADEEPMKAALKDLRMNSRLLPLLPYLVNFVANGVKTVSHDTAQLGRLLHTVKALVMNPTIYLEPYLTMLIQTIQYCEIEPLAASINPQNDHWTLRDYAAHLLGLTIWKLDTPINQLKQSNLTTLCEVLSDNCRPFSTHYGAVMGILAMGLPAVRETLFPMISTYWGHLEESLRDSSAANALVKSDAQKVYGALLLVAEYIVRAHIQHTQVSIKAAQKEEDWTAVTPGAANLQTAPSCLNPIVVHNDRFIDGDLPGAVITLPDSSTPAPKSFSVIYNQLYECFGDSLAARLPITYFPDFYEPRKEPAPVSFADADTARTGDELLQQFLEHPSSTRRNTLDTPENMDVDEKSNPSVWSARSSRSDENMSYMGEDTDLTIKATVSDPSRGIKMTILKRPKTKVSTPTNPQPIVPPPTVPPAPPQVPVVQPVEATASPKKPKLGRKSSLPKSVKAPDVFELSRLRERDVIFVFSFQGRVQHCVFSERQKALILARDMALQHAAVSKYRTLCSSLRYYGKRPKSSGATVSKRPAVRGALDLGHIL